jgi:hypothetical protein
MLQDDRNEPRRQLHAAADRILHGPVDGNIDGWVVQVLVDIGSVIRAAGTVLDYEVGRIMSGVDRPEGNFNNTSWDLSWQGAGIEPTPEQAYDWISKGQAARGDRPSAATQQRALAALLRPIASISCHSWLHDLADGFDALSFGEAPGIFGRSTSGLHGYKQARSIWQIRLRALAWAEFQYRAKLMKKTTAIGEVASAFGIRNSDSITDWKKRAKALFGPEIVQEQLRFSGAAGLQYHSLKVKIGSGAVERSAVAHEMEYFERLFGPDILVRLAQAYKQRARKNRKANKTKAIQPGG